MDMWFDFEPELYAQNAGRKSRWEKKTGKPRLRWTDDVKVSSYSSSRVFTVVKRQAAVENVDA